MRRARCVFPLLEALPEAETEGFIFNIFCFVHWKKKKKKERMTGKVNDVGVCDVLKEETWHMQGLRGQ